MTRPLTAHERERYARHLLLPWFGETGQAKLLGSRVLVVGAGGLGSPVLSYLAAAGVGHLTVIDHDRVDSSNLQRQVIHTVESIGTPKVTSATRAIRALNPNMSLTAVDAELSVDNVTEIVNGHDLVIDGTDNFATRYLLNDVCVALGLPYIWAAIFAFDATLSVFDSTRGPCYRCLHPTPPPAGSVPSCAEGGVLGVLPGHIGTAQATEAIKVLTGVGQPMIGRIASYSALSGEWDYIPLIKSPTCPSCSQTKTVPQAIAALEPTLAACAVNVPDTVAEFLIEPVDLATWLQEREAVLLDVRTVDERKIVTIPGSTHVPLDEVINNSRPLDQSVPVVVYCKSGARSAQAAQALRTAGHESVYEVAGGILSWVSQVSPAEATY